MGERNGGECIFGDLIARAESGERRGTLEVLESAFRMTYW